MTISLVVQWLPPCATVAADTGFIGGQGTKIRNAMGTASPPRPPPKPPKTNKPTHTHTHTKHKIHIQAKTGLPGGSDDKESTCNSGDPSSIPGSGSSPGEEIGYPLQYSWASLVAQVVNNPLEGFPW